MNAERCPEELVRSDATGMMCAVVLPHSIASGKAIFLPETCATNVLSRLVVVERCVWTAECVLDRGRLLFDL